MKVSRRSFLKGILATAGAAIVAPQALVESAHGASDLTPRERDIAAEVMGLRKKYWVGVDWATGISRASLYMCDNLGTIVPLKTADMIRTEYPPIWSTLTMEPIYRAGPTEITVTVSTEQLESLWNIVALGAAPSIQLKCGVHTIFQGTVYVDAHSLDGDGVATAHLVSL